MYWERDQEITLLHLVLEANHPDEDSDKVDTIVCGLIEMGLVDADRAPWAQRAWQDAWVDGYEIPRTLVERYYVTEDEYLADMYGDVDS